MKSFVDYITSNAQPEYEPYLIYPAESASGISNILFNLSTRKITGDYTVSNLPIEYKSGVAKRLTNNIKVPKEGIFTKNTAGRSFSVEFFIKMRVDAISSLKQIIKFNNATDQGLFLMGQHLMLKVSSTENSKYIIVSSLEKIKRPLNIIMSQVQDASNCSVTLSVNGRSSTVLIPLSEIPDYNSTNDYFEFVYDTDILMDIGGIYFYDYQIRSGELATSELGTINHFKYAFQYDLSSDLDYIALKALYGNIKFFNQLDNNQINYKNRIDAGSKDGWTSNFPSTQFYGLDLYDDGISTIKLSKITSASISSASPLTDTTYTSGTEKYRALNFGHYLQISKFLPSMLKIYNNVATEVSLSILNGATVDANPKDLIAFIDSVGNGMIRVSSKKNTNTTSDIIYKIVNSSGKEVPTASGVLISNVSNSKIKIGCGFNLDLNQNELYYKLEQATEYSITSSSMAFAKETYSYLANIDTVAINNSIRYNPNSAATIDVQALSASIHNTSDGSPTIVVRRILLGELADLQSNSNTTFNKFVYKYDYDSSKRLYSDWSESVYNASAFLIQLPMSTFKNSTDASIPLNNRIEFGYPNTNESNAASAGFYIKAERVNSGTLIETKKIKQDSSLDFVKTDLSNSTSSAVNLYAVLDYYPDIRYFPPILKNLRFFVNNYNYITADEDLNNKIVLSKSMSPAEIFGGLSFFNNTNNSGLIFDKTDSASAIYDLSTNQLPTITTNGVSTNQIGTIAFFVSTDGNEAQRKICTLKMYSAIFGNMPDVNLLFSGSITSTGAKVFRTDSNIVDKIYINGASCTFTNDLSQSASVAVDYPTTTFSNKNYNFLTIVLKSGYELSTGASWTSSPTHIIFGGPKVYNFNSACVMYMDEIMLFPGRLSGADVSKVFSNYKDLNTQKPTFDFAKTFGNSSITSTGSAVVNILDKETLFNNINFQLTSSAKMRNVLLATDSLELPAWATSGSEADKRYSDMNSTSGNPDYCIDGVFIKNDDFALVDGQVYGMLFLPPLTSSGYYEMKYTAAGGKLKFLDSSGNQTNSSPSSSAINNTASIYYVQYGNNFAGEYLVYQKDGTSSSFFNNYPQIYKVKVYKDLP